jgi:hypothetical protein
MRTFRAAAAGIAAVTLWAAPADVFARDVDYGMDAIQRVEKAIEAYMVLRDEATQALPPLEISPDAENFLIATDAMAAAIRLARPSAAEGDVVNPEAAILLRHRIRGTLAERGCGVADILAEQRDSALYPTPPRPIVHDQFDWGWGSFMPACVLRVLPPLPEDLQFRFVQRDLVLVDVGADLVIDVLPDALPPLESWKGVRYAAACLPERDCRIFMAWPMTAGSSAPTPTTIHESRSRGVRRSSLGNGST